jgi:hypothetical protein
MNKKIIKIMLTDKDKKTLSSNQKICTDSHGSECDIKSETKK